MTTLVIAPISEEIEVLTRAFDQLLGSHEVRDAGRVHVREYQASDVILAQGGLGKVQFAITTQHLLDNLADPSLVVCAGVAGSLTKSARVGDVVVGTATVEHDFNDNSPGRLLPRFDGSARHVAALRQATEAGQSSFQVHFGQIASGDESIVDPVRASELHDRTDALAVAWEGAGGARAAGFSQIPYVEVRGISDMADHDAPDTWEANLPATMQNVSSIVAWLAEHAIPAQAAEHRGAEALC